LAGRVLAAAIIAAQRETRLFVRNTHIPPRTARIVRARVGRSNLKRIVKELAWTTAQNFSAAMSEALLEWHGGHAYINVGSV
jgi:hypothetical protein